MESAAEPAAYPAGGRRLIIYVAWDRRGSVDDYIPYALEGLRRDAAYIVVVANRVSDEGRTKLESVADEILAREDRGHDIGAYRNALDHLGERIADFDELVLTNDAWFGPIRPYGPVLERMAARSVHFWGMTDHAEEEPHPSAGKGVLSYHLQPSWIGVRREMFLSDVWKEYWRDAPAMHGDLDAAVDHQVVFTEHFESYGFTHDVAFPSARYPTARPALLNAELLLADGCPLLAKRVFADSPLLLDRHAVIGREIAALVESYGYPMPLLWQSLARNVEPRVLNTNAGMLEVLPDVDISYEADEPLRIVAILHVFYTDMTDEMLDRVDALPGRYDLVITTPDETRAEQIRKIVERRPREGRAVDVRVVESNDGRDQSAFLIGCRDVLLGGDYDLVVKLHSKRTPQDDFNIGRHFKVQQFRNLLNSPGYAANIIALFQREPGLGIVFPPMIHIGYPTMGHAWWANKDGTAQLCQELGIRVPLDDASPLAPYGSMFVARPDALRLLVEHGWSYEQFGGADAYRDGGLAHVLERMPVYAAGELGYHVRTVTTADYMSISHTALEYKTDRLSATLPGDIVDAVRHLQAAGDVGEGRLIDFARTYLRLHHPGMAAALRRVVGRDTTLGRVLRRYRGQGGEAAQGGSSAPRR